MDRHTGALFRELLQLIAPREMLTVSEWTEENRVLFSDTSSMPGKWDLTWAPYQKDMMDAVSDPDVEEVVFMTSAQIGKTEILLNILGYYIDYEPSPMIYMLPTTLLAEAYSKDRIGPMIMNTPVLRVRVREAKSRDSNNTIRHKKFVGGQLSIIGANSAAELSGRPVRIVLCDEVDRFPASAGKEGDPFELVKKRTATFRNRKIIAVSTPTVKGASKIEDLYNKSTMEQWMVPCPRCGHMQIIEFPRLKFPKEPGEKPTMRCEFCEEHFTERDWKNQFVYGEWRGRQQSKSRGFHINELCSPWRSWDDVIEDFKEARKKGEEVFKVWINTSLGETWEERGDSADEDSLNKRREVYGAPLPKGVLLLTAGIDVQDDRFEIEVVGWNRDYESWGIEYKKIFGDLDKPEVWKRLDEYIDGAFQFEDGTRLNIAIACIDSGGHFTTEVYKFCKKLRRRNIYAIKGRGGDGLPFLYSVSKNNSEKVALYILGVDAGKESLLSRLKTAEPGPGFCHFPKETDRGYDFTYFQGLTGEYRVPKMVKGVPKLVWVKKQGVRNEPLDIRNYATAALEIISPVNWGALEGKLAKGINYLEKAPAKRKTGVVNKGVQI